MITIDTELKRLLSRAEIEPVVVVDIQTDTTTHTYYTASNKLYNGYPNIVSKISSISLTADIEDFSSQVGGLTVDFVDEGAGNGTLRTLLNSEYLRNKSLHIKFGTHGVDLSDFVPVWSGVITDVIPLPGSLKIKGKTADYYNNKEARSFNIAVGNKHPRQYIWTAFYIDGIDTTNIDLDIFTPWYNWDERFLNVYGSEEIVQEDISTRDLIEQMCLQLRAWFVAREDGTFDLKQYDSTDSIVDTWYEEDIADIEYEIIYNNIKNSASAYFKEWDPDQCDAATSTYVAIDRRRDRLDTTAASDTGSISGSFEVWYEFDIEHNNKIGVLGSAMTSSQTTLPLSSEYITGNRYTRNGGFHGFVNADSNDMISPGTYYYLFDYTTDYIRFEFDDGVYGTDLYLTGNPSTQAEFRDDWYDRITSEFNFAQLMVKKGTGTDYNIYLAAGPLYNMVHTTTNAASHIWTVSWRTPDSSSAPIIDVGGEHMTWTGTPTFTSANRVTVYDQIGPLFADTIKKVTSTFIATLPTVTRGALSTSAAAHSAGDSVYDITTYYKLLNYYIERFKYGCPIINLRTNLSKIDVQLLDFVSLELLDIHWKTQDGITDSDISSYKWQVISKSFDLFSSKPSIKWKLAYVG